MSKYFSLTVSTSKYFNRVCSHVILNAWVFSVIMVAMVIIFQHLLILKSAKNRKCKQDYKQKNQTQYCCIYFQSFGGVVIVPHCRHSTLYGSSHHAVVLTCIDAYFIWCVDCGNQLGIQCLVSQ